MNSGSCSQTSSSWKCPINPCLVVKQQMDVLKLFQVTSGSIHSFQIRSEESLRIMYPKYPVLDMIQRIHRSCGSIIHFWILVKKQNVHFWIKNPDLDFSKEMHP